MTVACDGRVVRVLGEGEHGSSPSAGAGEGGEQGSAGGGHAAGTSGSSEEVGSTGATGGAAGASSSGGPGAGGDGPGYSVVFRGDGEYESLYAAALDAQGRLVVGGGADGTLSLNGEDHAGAVLLWLSPSGELVQAKSFGSAAYETQVNGIAPVADGSIIAVGTYRTTVVVRDEIWVPTNENWGPDMFVMKVAANGEVIWARHFGGAGYDGAESAAVAPNGNVYVSGYVSSAIDFGGGVHAAGEDTAFLLTLDADGGYVASQVFSPRGDLDAWPMTNATGMALGRDGTVWLTGHAGLSEGSGSYLTQVSPTGQLLTRKFFGDDGYTLASDINGVRGGGALIVGNMNGTADFGEGPRNAGDSTKLFAARFGPGGEPLWSSLLGDAADYDYDARASAVAADGSVFITGGAFHVADNPMLVRFAADGTPDEPEVFNAIGRFFAVCTGGEHSVYLAGKLDGSSDFGFGPVRGRRDFVVVRLVR
ncbi:hypothetical protein predicted by Glimmer/Critica [Sorangium cellulosum So ce56]|uniref:Beta-propeller repeat protein n=1 Tax=Sorangium cellulosum (strain So ce56) TaxID=448385 RepID=A9FFX3_SORC5|nr:hypothetical protein predicted by Glimmer/Critica [Sorangium cellulosum So ce56]